VHSTYNVYTKYTHIVKKLIVKRSENYSSKKEQRAEDDTDQL